jgi:hypothetical protein
VLALKIHVTGRAPGVVRGQQHTALKTSRSAYGEITRRARYARPPTVARVGRSVTA